VPTPDLHRNCACFKRAVSALDYVGCWRRAAKLLPREGVPPTYLSTPMLEELESRAGIAATQRAEEVGQTFPLAVWALYTFEFWQQFVGQIGAPALLGRAGIAARTLDDNFMHIWSHNDLMIDG
jgi:hypothetical protein